MVQCHSINLSSMSSYPPRNETFTILMLGESFHSEELAGHQRKVDPKESDSLDRFAFVRWYVGKEFSLDSTEEA